MYVGVIQGLVDQTRRHLCIPHVCGGDPTVLFEDLKKRVVFPMYVGVIPRCCLKTLKNALYSPCMWG